MSRMFAKRNQGFALPAILVTVLVGLVVSGAAWYVWQQNALQTPKAQTAQAKPAEKKPYDPSEGGKYFVIKEWGVRFVMPPKLDNEQLQYVTRKHADVALIGEPQYADLAYFTSTQLSKVGCGLKPGPAQNAPNDYDPVSKEQGPGIVIERSSERLRPEWSTDKHIGSYWYRHQKGTAGSCYQSSTGGLEALVIGGVIESFPSLEAIPTEK